MAAAAAIAEARGYDTVVIDEPVVGEARVAGPALVQRARSQAGGRRRPCCVIASGETTVRVTGTGRGGRNQELVLGAVPALAEWAEAVTMASVGTDGRDGPTDAAGAVADVSTATRARRAGLAPVADWLADNDAYAFFDALGDLVRTGPTGTNVADLQVVLIG
jgi:glycerate 2-kinase